MTSAPTRKDKKKEKKERKRATEESIFLNSPGKATQYQYFRQKIGFNYDYKRLFHSHECSACGNQISQLVPRFIRDDIHQHIMCISCPCGKKLDSDDFVEEDVTIGCSCKLAYKLIKMGGIHWDRDTKIPE
jgi:hypothetical protein